MAEGLTDDELQTVVDAYKKVQLETHMEMSSDTRSQ